MPSNNSTFKLENQNSPSPKKRTPNTFFRGSAGLSEGEEQMAHQKQAGGQKGGTPYRWGHSVAPILDQARNSHSFGGYRDRVVVSREPSQREPITGIDKSMCELQI
jgi:hypothetical protein